MYRCYFCNQLLYMKAVSVPVLCKEFKCTDVNVFTCMKRLQILQNVKSI